MKLSLIEYALVVCLLVIVGTTCVAPVAQAVASTFERTAAGLAKVLP